VLICNTPLPRGVRSRRVHVRIHIRPHVRVRVGQYVVGHYPDTRVGAVGQGRQRVRSSVSLHIESPASAHHYLMKAQRMRLRGMELSNASDAETKRMMLQLKRNKKSSEAPPMGDGGGCGSAATRARAAARGGVGATAGESRATAAGQHGTVSPAGGTAVATTVRTAPMSAAIGVYARPSPTNEPCADDNDAASPPMPPPPPPPSTSPLLLRYQRHCRSSSPQCRGACWNRKQNLQALHDVLVSSA